MNSQNTNIILSNCDNILITTGLQDSFVGEVVKVLTPSGYPTDTLGVIMALDIHFTRVVIIEQPDIFSEVRAGYLVARTHEYVKTNAGYGALGLVITVLGKILNESDYDSDSLANHLNYLVRIDIGADALSIIERDTIKTPFMTGIAAIDTFLPIGCGQRELIIGDHATGKTSLAITIVLNQRHIMCTVDYLWRLMESGLSERLTTRYVPCVFVFIGKRRSELLRLKNVLISRGSLKYTCLVFSSADDLAAVQYFSAYAGCAIAEWFRNKGFHSLVIYDDLSQHAVAYRQMSLLLRRPPGREAYPGDVFYVHSKLLERSSLAARYVSGGSVTCFPIIETKGGDISSYIPTNVISITDGQIFLSKVLYNKGLRPAIDLGLSVSRVGSKSQYDCIKYISRKIKKDYMLFKTYEGLAKLSTDLEASVVKQVNRGYVIISFFSQEVYHTYRLFEQVLGLFLISSGHLDEVDPKYVSFYFDVLFRSETGSLFLSEAPELVKWTDPSNLELFESYFRVYSMKAFSDDLDKLGSLFTPYFQTKILSLALNDPYYIAGFKAALVLKSFTYSEPTQVNLFNC